MLIMANKIRWTRYGRNFWFDHKAGQDYPIDDEIWFDNRALLIRQGVVLATISKDDFWDLEKDNYVPQGFT